MNRIRCDWVARPKLHFGMRARSIERISRLTTPGHPTTVSACLLSRIEIRRVLRCPVIPSTKEFDYLSKDGNAMRRYFSSFFVLAIVIAGCTGIVWFSATAYRRWELRKCNESIRNAMRIANGLLGYWERHNCLPPAYVLGRDGKPSHSWRVLLLPYIGEKALYDQYDFTEPWDGPHNRRLWDKMPQVYGSPYSADRSGLNTNYVAVIGPETVWRGDKSVSWADFPNSTANTIALIEVANSGINWMEPRDESFSELFSGMKRDAKARLRSGQPDGANIFIMASGSLRFGRLTLDELKELLTVRGGDVSAFDRRSNDVSPEE